MLREAGLKVATQKYEYTSSGITHEGQNVYAIIHAPRGDATEAIVLVAAWKTADGELNLSQWWRRGLSSHADDDHL